MDLEDKVKCVGCGSYSVIIDESVSHAFCTRCHSIFEIVYLGEFEEEIE